MKIALFLAEILVCSSLWAAPLWKLSDILGHDLGPADSNASQMGWKLQIEPFKGGEKRTLFHDGKEDTSWILGFDSSGRTTSRKEIRGSQVVWETDFDPSTGIPTREISFQDNEPDRVADLVFDNRILVKRTVRDGQGKLLYTDRLFHWPDGTLRRLERDELSRALADAEWTYGPEGGLASAWSVDPDEMTVGQHREWTFGPGRTEERLVSASGPLSTRITEDLPDGRSQDTKTDLESSRVEKQIADKQGRTVFDEVSQKGEPSQISRWNYDSRGRVTESSEDSNGSRVSWKYAYAEDGTTNARMTRDGVLVREEKTKDGEKLTVRLYDHGELFLLEDWSQGRKVKETYYRHGTIVRERQL